MNWKDNIFWGPRGLINLKHTFTPISTSRWYITTTKRNALREVVEQSVREYVMFRISFLLIARFHVRPNNG